MVTQAEQTEEGESTEDEKSAPQQVEPKELETIVAAHISEELGWEPPEMSERGHELVDAVNMADANSLDTVIQITFKGDFSAEAHSFIQDWMDEHVEDERVAGLADALLDAGVMDNWVSCLNWPAAWEERPLMPVLAYLLSLPLIEAAKDSPYPHLFRGGVVALFARDMSSGKNLLDDLEEVVEEEMTIGLDDEETKVVSLSKWRQNLEADPQHPEQSEQSGSPIITP